MEECGGDKNFQIILLCQKLTWFVFICKNIGLGEQLSLLTFFENLYKNGPDFCHLGIPPFKKTINISWKPGHFFAKTIRNLYTQYWYATSEVMLVCSPVLDGGLAGLAPSNWSGHQPTHYLDPISARCQGLHQAILLFNVAVDLL